jgi:flagellar hook assembly protein FlgD
MPLKSRSSSKISRALAVAGLAIFGALLPRGAFAQASLQVYVNDAFVETTYGGFCSVGGTPPRYTCPIQNSPTTGNISNEPEIQFAQNGQTRCNVPLAGNNPNIAGTIGYNVCNSQVYLCTQIGLGGVTATVGTVQVDLVEFEIFRFIDGSNPLDPASTPPLKTFFIDNPGFASNGDASKCVGSSCFLPDLNNSYCVLWDGSQNVQGTSAKVNGQYGFRVTVQTNQVGASGNITITQTRAYPSGATFDSTGASVGQKNLLVDVSDVHVVRSTPTVVGAITGVSAEPYNFTYRLSKDATMYLTVNESFAPFNMLRKVVPGLPRTGEGAIANANSNPLINGDSWDGRDNFGNFMPPGSYLAVFQSNSSDQYGGDLSDATTSQIGIDPLQITDIRVQPLLGGSTSLAVLSYQLTEPATVYIDIYPPGTQFCNDSNGQPALSDVNSTATDPGLGVLPAKNFSASSGSCGSTVAPIRSIIQQQNSRVPVIGFWDGRDSTGNLVGDGDYVFVIYASLPSQAGVPYNGVAGDRRVWTSLAKNGYISVLRGLVGLTQITPTSTIIGSSPAIAGLNPFTFRYQVSRDAVVSLKIYDSTGLNLVKTIVNQEQRPGLFNNVETWYDGTDDNGRAVSSGTYLVQLTAADPAFPAKISTTTAQFPVNMFRITDVSVTPLLSGASDQVILNYQLSQPMFVAWNIYPAGSVVTGSASSWPPCSGQSPPGTCMDPSIVSPLGAPVAPVVTFHGLRPGRLKISEFWDGRDVNGLFIPDGSYVYTLVAQSTTTPQYYATDRIFGFLTVARGAIVFTSFNVTPDVPPLFNSSNTITLPPYTISYALTRQSSVTVQILNTAIPPSVVRNLVTGSVRQNGILQTDVWDGRDDRGNFLPNGFYIARAIANDVASQLSSGSTAQQTISYDPLRIFDLAVTPLRGDTGGAVIAYQVSEPMKVSIKIYKPGTSFDLSGNPTPTEATSLVRRIVGIRPGRTQIQDTWDGRDFRLAPVPDGNYKFKIVGSTDPTAIDSISGNVLYPTSLSEDRLIDDVPVAVNSSQNPVGDFQNATFSYPNPLSSSDPQACFHIYNPFNQARAIIKLFNMSGDLVNTHDFGNITGSFNSPNLLSNNAASCGGTGEWAWTRTNSAGRPVARGIYYAVIRLEETEGGAQTLQTVKKVFIK